MTYKFSSMDRQYLLDMTELSASCFSEQFYLERLPTITTRYNTHETLRIE